MKVKEIRWMNASDLRNLCIQYNWFTRGDNDQYRKFLHSVSDHKRNLTTKGLLKLALTIQKYSRPENYVDLGLGGIMFCLSEICHTSFTIEGADDNE